MNSIHFVVVTRLQFVDFQLLLQLLMLYSVRQPVRPSHFINKISREKRTRDKSISFYATLKIYRADSQSPTTISKPTYIWLWFCVTARFKSRLSQPSKTVQGSPCTLPNYQIWECIEGPTKKMS